MRLKSLLKRLVDKIVKDALPAGLASILGGLLLTHFQIDRVPQPTTVKVTQASPEMMQLLRDEHGMIIDFVEEQVASEKAAAAPIKAGSAVVTEASLRPRCRSPCHRPRSGRSRLSLWRRRSPSRRAARTRLSVLRCRRPRPRPRKLSRPIRCLRRRERMIRLLAKAIGIKDQVVSVTQRAVSATIGVIPSWFGSLGDRIGGEGQSPRPPANLVSASWILPSAADR